MPKEKLYLPDVRPLTYKKANMVRAEVTDETFKKLHELQDKTGLSLQYIANQLIEFSIDDVEVISKFRKE